jgi:hypothetical protein
VAIAVQSASGTAEQAVRRGCLGEVCSTQGLSVLAGNAAPDLAATNAGGRAAVNAGQPCHVVNDRVARRKQV